MPGAKKGSKGRKIGRNKLKCQSYRLHQRFEKNQLRRLTRHLGMHTNDQAAMAFLAALRDRLGVRVRSERLEAAQ